MNRQFQDVKTAVPDRAVPARQADGDLVAGVKAGDDRAYDVLMERYKRPVLNFVFRMIGDPVEAQDVAQDVFLRAYLRIREQRFKETGGGFQAWIFRIARHAAIDCIRRRKRRPTESLAALRERGRDIPGGDRNAAENYSAGETRDMIAAAVAGLPPDQRTALILAEYESLSHAGIAAVMNCSRKSVEARLYRARRFLRKRLAALLER